MRGFRLAGVAGQAVATPAEAAAALEKAARDPECGILILTQSLAAGIRSRVDAMRVERERPLLVEIPGPEGPVPGTRNLRQLVQEAVGIRLG